MARTLSADLRDRVVAAIASGLSRRQAAVRLGVSAASAVRWQQLANQHGTPAPQQQGGDRRAMRIEAHAKLILEAYEAMPDITLAELQALLANHGTDVALGTMWRFFARRGITRKKDNARDRAGSPRHPEAAQGMVRRPARSRPRAAHLHRRDVGIDEHGTLLRPSATRRMTAGRCAARALKTTDLRRGSDPHGHDRDLGARRSDER